MPTTTNGMTTHETWLDWVPAGDPEPELYTRDELIDELRKEGVSVNYRNLEHWQLQGVLPYPVRRRHRGATRALYPGWMVPAVKDLRNLQARGVSLAEIAPRLRSWPLLGGRHAEALVKPQADLRAAIKAYAVAYKQATGRSPDEAILDLWADGGRIHQVYVALDNQTR